MSKRDKLRRKLRNHPKGAKFSEVETLLLGFGFILARVSGSHHVFRYNDNQHKINAKEQDMFDEDDEDDDNNNLNAIDTKIIARDNHKADAAVKTDKSSGADQTKTASASKRQWEKKPSNLCAYPPTANRQDGGSKSKEPANSSENMNSRHL